MKLIVEKRKRIFALLFTVISFGFLIAMHGRFAGETFFLKQYLLAWLFAAGAAALKWVQFSAKVTQNLFLSILLSLCMPFLLFPMMEWMIGNTFAKLWEWSICLNLALIFLLIWLFYAVSRRFCFSLRAAAVICYIVGLAQDVVLEFRGQPISALDLYSWQTAASVAGRYRYSFGMDFWISTMLLLFIWSLSGLCRAKRTGWTGYFINLALCLGCAGAFFYSFYETPLLDDLGIQDYQWNQKLALEDNGALLSLVYSTKYLMLDVADNYTPELALKTMEKSARREQAQSDVRPNIIAIMNESFADLSVVGELETTEDYLPFYHSLIGAENAITGNLVVSTFGGGTCNTEYEFLTGGSMAFFPSGSVVYQQYLHDALPSLVSTLQSQGYSSAAVHPFYSYCWNRKKVYPLLGFERFLDISAFADARTMGGYMGNSVSDESDYDKLIALYEEKQENERLFLFNVTMQNHGGYSQISGCDWEIGITNLANSYPEAENYLSLVRESDAQLQRLVEYFSQQTEPTILVFFGDHQPNLSDSFYDDLYGVSADEMDLAQIQNKYKTPFVIWANYDIDEAQIGDLSANYLSTLVLETAGLKMPLYNRYLSQLRSRLPVINLNGYATPDGQCYSFEDETDFSARLDGYRLAQYNLMFDKNHRLNEAFTLTG